MLTDWVLVRRAGAELERRLAGARVTAAGMLVDGRYAIALHARSEDLSLVVAPFGTPPLVTLEPGALPLPAQPGFPRALDALRGMRLLSVRARAGDRLLRLTFGARSRFGVGDELELFLELVPRFGNLVLVKRDRIVAAAKTFSLAENPRRAVEPGMEYALPPLPAEAPAVPRAVEAAGVDPVAFLAFARGDEMLAAPLYVDRSDGAPVQAHVVELAQPEGTQRTREPSLLAVFSDLRATEAGRVGSERANRRRGAVVKKLAERERKLRAELAAADGRRSEAGTREILRADGEAIYATLHELPPEQAGDAKERATKLFARYKKLGAALPHLDRREAQIRSALEGVETLRWEAERVAGEDLDDLESAVAHLDPAARQAPTPARRRKRTPLEFRTVSGSRILVGRSPVENADLTFRIARPSDWWLHARGIPGAHVVIARDDRSEPPEDDVRFAAALAAFHSKARASAKVAVDVAPRKHVRKQRDAAPGLVWYTNARTILVEPADGAEVGAAPAGKSST